MRPTPKDRIMMEVELNALWATCQRLHTACAIVDNYGSIVVSGRNGTPKDMHHCIDLPPLEGRCPRCVHAEKNAINQAARTGIAIRGNDLYTLYRPCIACANDIVAVQFGAVFWRHEYDSDGQTDYVKKMFEEARIFWNIISYTDVQQTFSTQLESFAQSIGLPRIPLASS